MVKKRAHLKTQKSAGALSTFPVYLTRKRVAVGIGHCKAVIETLLLRFCYQYMSVIFGFIGGGIAACLRFVYEMSHA